MGFAELLVIAVVAIIFLGPEKLPKFLIDTAKFLKSVKRAINDAKVSLEEEIKISELKEEAMEYKKKMDTVSKEVQELVHIEDLEDISDLAEQKRENEDKVKRENAKKEVVKFKKREDFEDKDKVNV